MKRKYLSIPIIILAVLSLLCVPACDSTSGRSKLVTIASYRNNYQFQLPINVSRKTNSPDSIKYFKSKETLTQICENINIEGIYIATECDGYILIHDEKYGYCIISPAKYNDYNYLITNMSFDFDPVESNKKYDFILAPLHMMSVPFDSGKIIENVEYDFFATKKEVISFYNEYEFQVTESENGIIVVDPIGRFYGNETSFDAVVEQFGIRLNENKIAFYYVHEEEY